MPVLFLEGSLVWWTGRASAGADPACGREVATSGGAVATGAREERGGAVATGGEVAGLGRNGAAYTW